VIRLRTQLWAALLGGVAVLGCREQLTTPADCPQLCPSSRQTVLDTIIEAKPNADSSFAGYIGRSEGQGMLVAQGLPGAEARGILRFLPRDTLVTVKDTARRVTGTDSVVVTLTLRARDTLATQLRILFYRLPSTIDSTSSFATVDAGLTPAALLDSLAVPDTLKAGTLRFKLAGATLTRAGFAAGLDTLGFAMTVHAVVPTGVRLSNAITAGPPAAVVYERVAIADAALQPQAVSRAVALATYVTPDSPPGPPIDPSLLTVGGAPSVRSLVRFALPPRIRDSAIIMKATLELVPTAPFGGIPNITDSLFVAPILADLGKKSPTSSSLTSTAPLPVGFADTLRVDVTGATKVWQGVNPPPSALFLSVLPEAASFTRPIFFSTRSAAGHPRLRITYQLPFPFEKP
jgi:hypothetical protein